MGIITISPVDFLWVLLGVVGAIRRALPVCAIIFVMDIAIGKSIQRTLSTFDRGKYNLVIVHELRTTYADLQGVNGSSTGDGRILAGNGYAYAFHLKGIIVRREYILITAAGSEEGHHGKEQYLIWFHHIVIFTL